MYRFNNFNSICAVKSLIKSAIQTRLMATDDLKAIFQNAVSAVHPKHLIRENVSMRNSHLIVKGRSIKLQKPCYVVGFGKAVLGMAVELERILGHHLKEGIVTIPTGIFESFKNHKNLLPSPETKIDFIEGAYNNLPDENALKGAEKIRTLALSLKEDDLLIVLISGGGSALLPLPKNNINLHEKLNVIQQLANKGADIVELNCVRKKMSLLKGGGLAEFAYPAKVISLILSDIIDDPLDFIASGPTTVNLDNSDAAKKIIQKYSIYNKIPDSVKKLLNEENPRKSISTKIVNNKYIHVENNIIGSNKIAAENALKSATTLGYQSAILSTSISGEVSKISKIYTELAYNISCVINDLSNLEKLKKFLQLQKSELKLIDSTVEKIIHLNFTDPKGICLIAGGEPTVIVKGNGKGGRNQQLTLDFSIQLNNLPLSVYISFLSCGTDGIDGPTDAAGAIGSSELFSDSVAENIDLKEYLNDNDSYTFFSNYKNGKNLIKIGHTGTNVMDIHVLLIKPKV